MYQKFHLKQKKIKNQSPKYQPLQPYLDYWFFLINTSPTTKRRKGLQTDINVVFRTYLKDIF